VGPKGRSDSNSPRSSRVRSSSCSSGRMRARTR
jgi:hypothetical protein